MSKKQSRRQRKSDGKRRGVRVPPVYEQGLLAIEQYERPQDYPGLTAETRRSASRAQFISFARSYWPDWRHTKIRMYRRLLEQREAISTDEATRLKAASIDPDIWAYQELTNGLLAAAASEFCQYAEDLAILGHAVPSEDFFVRDLRQAQAGKMQSEVKRWLNVDDAGASRLLRFPEHASETEWIATDVGRDHVAALKRSTDRLRAVAALYGDWEFHFMRYKHGLLLALRYSDTVTKEYLQKQKTNLLGFPVAFDCEVPSEFNPKTVLVLPDAGERSRDVRLNAAHLAAEQNLLRMVPPSPLQPSIETFQETAAWVSQLQRVLLRNRVQEIQPMPGRPYYMPAEDPAVVIAFWRDGLPQVADSIEPHNPRP